MNKTYPKKISAMSGIILSFLLIFPLLSYLVWIGNNVDPRLFKISLELAVASVFFGILIWFMPLDDVRKEYSKLLIGAGLLIIAGLYWNTLFENYIRTSGYTGDIFRRVMHNFHSPIYGVGRSSKWPWGVMLILLSCSFVVRIICWKNIWIERRGFVIELSLWLLGFILVFALSDGSVRLITNVGHYRTFAADIPKFEGFAHVLRTYSQQMPQLSVHNAHYPPGNLLLIMAESSLGGAWFSRAVVICFTLLTLLPIAGIASELHLSTYAKHTALLLFISSPVVLSLPSVAMTPIPMFLGATALWLVLAAMRKESTLCSVAVGGVMVLYSFLSFTSLITGFLLVVIVVGQFFVNRIRLRVLLRLGAVAIAIFLLLCWVFYRLTDFNLFLCFVTGVEHNRNIMASGYDSVIRYFLRSSGNLIAWLCSIGFAAAVFGSLGGINALRSQIRGDRKMVAYNVAVLITVLLASFSTLFFLETERIWLFFVPVWVIVAATAIDTDLPATEKNFLLKGLLIFSICQAVGQELVFQPWR